MPPVHQLVTDCVANRHARTCWFQIWLTNILVTGANHDFDIGTSSQKMMQQFDRIFTSLSSSCGISAIGISSQKMVQHFETRSIWTVKFRSWQTWAFSSVLLVASNVDRLLKDEWKVFLSLLCRVCWQWKRPSKPFDYCAWPSVAESTMPKMRPRVVEER